MNHVESVATRIDSLQKRCQAIGLVALVPTIVGAVLLPEQFFRSYLLGFIFWMNLTLGCFGWVIAHNLTGGDWGEASRRFLEAGMRLLPLMLVLFLPVLAGLPRLYEWASPEHVAHDAILQQKAFYLNVPFFLIRAAGYFLIWLLISHFLYKWSGELERTPSLAIVRRLENLSGPGSVIFALTATFASFDWVMSLEPHWYSTIYGLLFIVGQGLNALAFAIVLTTYFSEAPPFSHYLTEKHFHDLGKLTHGFVVFWAYGTFAQYLIIWCGNLPEEIPWYLHRTSHGWGIVAIALMVFHFFVPFFLLLSRTNKRRKNVLVKIALAIIVMRFIDLYWMIIPSFPNNGLYIHWLYIVTPIALGGIWLAVFFSQLKARSLAPLPDPFTETEQALEHA